MAYVYKNILCWWYPRYFLCTKNLPLVKIIQATGFKYVLRRRTCVTYLNLQTQKQIKFLFEVGKKIIENNS